MNDSDEALFIVEWPERKKILPVDEALRLVLRAKAFVVCPDADDDYVSLFTELGLPDLRADLEARANATPQQIEVINSFLLPIGPIHEPHFRDGYLSLEGLRKFVQYSRGAVAIDAPPSPRLPIAHDLAVYLSASFKELPESLAARVRVAFKGVLQDRRDPAQIWDEITPDQRNLAAIAADESAEWMARAAAQEERKRKEGRYSLEEAARLIAVDCGEDEELMLAKLVTAAGSGSLSTYMPDRKAKNEYVSKVGRFKVPDTFFDECYWHDLNTWLTDNEPKVKYKFAGPLPELSKPQDLGSDGAQSINKRNGGRPKTIEVKAAILRRLIPLMLSDNAYNGIALPGSAADLHEACKRIEQVQTNKSLTFGGTTSTFKTWLFHAGYSMKNGRGIVGEEKYWTKLLPKVMGKLPSDIFPRIETKTA